ncbi:DUF551 domain-containing protein [Escherichia coli]|nr:hypothetical protein [Escherichia phage GER2]EEC7950249.1 DUF551 domain-containing protein [Escherichia coli]EFW8106699.1 DUF551 domain-containing protein [Shigella sonnei]EIG6219666.1 DUF551 domain-containing protein [Shigella dysenteriae]EIH4992393.1 DUF551 domain-containing protein [Shigella boydii]HDL6814360.1 DUF551 domain-containing protein [Escherichia coli 371_08]HDL6819248.1 DUF551 domain-containing protein [Escherichia coli 290_10]HDL6833501.1 DUF551 domain-containing protein [E
MTAFTDKELIKEIKERISSLEVRDNIERRVYEIALTALTAEPFATIDTVGIELVKYGCNTFICPDNSMEPGNVPLYIGLPRIEPASQTAKRSFQEWLSEQKEKIDVDCGCVSIETLTHWMKSAYEAGNSPVTPDGWISCSERIPDDKQYVWCWGKSYGWTECDTFEGYYDWSRNKWWAVTDDGEEPASKVTHWMPLPEPPQEVN